MKDGLIHVCFVIDESGSMWGSESDVIGGFNKTIEEQKANKEGECMVSLFTFNENVKEIYLGKKLDEISGLTYKPGGCTAMYDGIGTAIDKVGKWLSEMDESERPSKNLIVIMTDGEENSSSEYSLKQVKEMIKHQEEKYSWTFVYMGTDITEEKDAVDLGIDIKMYTSRDMYDTNYKVVNSALTNFRNATDTESAYAVMDACLMEDTQSSTDEYERQIGKKIVK